MKKKPTVKYIALVSQLQKLANESSEIRVSIAVLSNDGKPRNWS